jgi:hypothetical protein
MFITMVLSAVPYCTSLLERWPSEHSDPEHVHPSTHRCSYNLERLYIHTHDTDEIGELKCDISTALVLQLFHDMRRWFGPQCQVADN